MLNKDSVEFQRFHYFVFSKETAFSKASINMSKIKKKTYVQSEFKKDMIRNLKAIQQFDKKFLISLDKITNNIFIFDQHAIHERILFEHYYSVFLKYISLNIDLILKFEKNAKFVNNIKDENEEYQLKIFSNNNFNNDIKDTFKKESTNHNSCVVKSILHNFNYYSTAGDKNNRQKNNFTLREFQQLINTNCKEENNIPSFNLTNTKRREKCHLNSNHNQILLKKSLKQPLKIFFNERIIEFAEKYFNLDKINSIMNFDFINEITIEGKRGLLLYSVPLIFDRVLYDEIYIEIFKILFLNLLKIFISQNINFDSLEYGIQINYFEYVLLSQPFIKLIKSRACRDSVKFNQEISKEVHKLLLYNLNICKHAFMCAHQRPNLFILTYGTG